RRARRDDGGPQGAPVVTAERAEEREQEHHEHGAGDRAPDREPARLREMHARGPKEARRCLSEGDEYRIAGRMGLMARDVEVGDAEGEVDRVEVFEGRRKEPEVR